MAILPEFRDGWVGLTTNTYVCDDLIGGEHFVVTWGEN